MNYFQISVFIFLSNLIFSSNPPSSFQFNQSSQQAFYFIVSAEVNGSSIQEGDWIGAFKENLCVGAEQWIGQYTSIPVMGDNGTEWSQGYMMPGEVPEFLIWDESENQVYHTESSDSFPWVNNGIFSIQMLPLEKLIRYPNLFNVQSYPNPFNGKVSIFIDSETYDNIDVKVYNLVGELTERIYSGIIFPGRTELVWNSRDLSSGVYFLQIDSGTVSVGKPLKKVNKKLYLIK